MPVTISTLLLSICFQIILGAVDSVTDRSNRTDLEARWSKYYQQFSNSKDDINLLAAVGSPLPPDVRPVTGPFGRYGRPAVEFTPQSYVGRWARDLLPLPFYKDFGIKVTIYLQSIQGGVLFTILEPDHSSIVLGLSILRVGKNNQSIEIVYKNPSKEYGSKELKATFVLPKFERRWIVFSIAISGQSVYLYFNGCEKVYSKVFEETRSSLVIKSNAPVFIGMAGWYIQKPILFGAVYDLTIYKDYKKAIPSCSRTEKSSTQHSNIGTSESGKSTIKPNPTRSPIKTSTEEDLNEDKVNENNKVDLSNQENPGGPAVPKESDAAQTTTTSSSTTASKTTIPSTTTTKIATKTTQLSRSTTVSPKTTTTKTTTTTQLTKTSTLSPKTTKTKPTTTTQSTKTTTITPKTTTTTKTTTTKSTKTSTLSPKTTTTSKTTQPTKTTTVRPKTTTSLLKTGPAMTTTTPTTTQSTKTTKVIPKTAMLKTTTPRSTENSIKSKTLSPTKEEKNPSKTTILKTTTSSPQPTKENNFIYETTATKQDENKIKTTQGPKMHDPTTYKPDENIASILNLYTTQSSTESTAVPTTIVDEVETTLVTTQDSIASAETSTSSTTTREGRNVNTINSINSLIKNFHSKISENIDKLRPTEQVTRTKSKIEITDADTTNPNTITEDFSTTQQKLVTTAMPQESKTTHSTFVSSTKQISAMETSEDVFPTVATIHKTDYVTHAVTQTIQSSTSRMRDIITTKASTLSRDFDLKKDLEEEMKKLEKDINNLMNLTIVTTSSTATINKKTVDKHDKTFPSKTTTTTPDTTKRDAKPNNVITTTMTIEHDVTTAEKKSTNNKVDMKPNPTTITTPEDTTYKPSTSSTHKTTTVPKVISTEKPVSGGELTIDELTQQVSQRLKNQLNAEEADKMTIRSVIIEILEERKNGFMKGSKGEKGDSVKGERGRIGLPGVTGLKGRKGDTGPMGPSGQSGENGRPGLNGLKGDRGLKGESGEKGERGYDGKDGVPGAGVGLPGPVGPQGERGLKGEAGIDGKDGGPGKDGEKGQRGDNGGPGVDGETGPAGAKGEKGDSVIGPKGERGPPGLPTAIPIHARLEKVEVRHGRPGKDGKPGPIGEKGGAGPAGMKGETGPIGPPGKDGSKGEPGISITGEKGEKGATGKPGQDGIQGYSGDQGPRGFNGAKGEKGAKGDTAEASKESLKAHILLTTRDMRLMFDMFSPGSFVLISSTNELYVRSLFGWLKIMTGASASTSANSLSGPTYFDQRRKKQIPTPGLMDRRLMNTHLKVPSAGVLIPRPYLLLMALNAPQSGQMGGVVGADYLCHKQAEVVNLPGRTFRAFLSNSYQNIRDLVDQDTARLPVANFRGEKIFDSYESIYNATMFAAFNPKIPIYSFNNRDVRHDENWPIKKIWHGSHAHGEHHFNKKSCSNWKSNVKSKKATASSLLSYTPALNEELTRCHRKLIVLCIQTSLR
ncbi:collagen alpha-1(XV) chain-like isoform X2 [Hydractinia symbiolongicarpus]|uniref:collagen alpha-1(XV) chain-like isoform X2 n=1 Tax=Hydractinia symbiolongicarpus TaxID=13093 RepID=UPI00254E63F7|nr:collagen alpha-1(XV) chain-like isoform X2 [Hydractinia symbiolongicarpus]